MISVVGEALIDAHFDGEVMRPHPGGGPFNTAVALGRLGVPVSFLGPLSTDAFGTLIARALASAGVVTDRCIRTDAATPFAMVGVSEHGDVDYRFYLQSTAFDGFGRKLPRVDSGAAAAFVGSLALALDPPGAAVEQFACESSSRCSLVIDPNVRPSLIADRRRYVLRFERLASLAAIVKLSRADANWLYPGIAVPAVATRLRDQGAACVVVTDGAAGAAGWTSRASAAARAPEVNVVDTVGAGDAFTAGFLAWLWGAASLGKDRVEKLNDEELECALAYGAAAGAAQCTRASAWGPRPDDVSEALRRVEHQPAQALKGG